jgi:hypothetical protein
MKKFILLVLALAVMQIAVYVAAQYVYYGLSDSCGIANDWYCSSTTASTTGVILQCSLMALLPPVLIKVLIGKSRAAVSWKRIIVLHAAVLAVVVAVTFAVLILTTGPSGR